MSRVSTCLWFDGQAEEAATMYVGLIPNSRITAKSRYPEGMPQAGQVLTVQFTLDGGEFMGLNGGPQYKHTPAMSISVQCDSQAEVDRLWTELCRDGGREVQCGWVTDRFGVSWQIVPRAFTEMMKSSDKAAVGRAVGAMMQMKKLDVAALQKAFDGE